MDFVLGADLGSERDQRPVTCNSTGKAAGLAHLIGQVVQVNAAAPRDSTA